MITISATPINIQSVIDAATNVAAGAVNIFLGTVRNNSHGKNVLRLEYEAYDAMAISEIEKIIEEASAKWMLLGYGISHRIGTLLPGEIAIVVAVSTAHRGASFAACEFIMDTIKTKVPIWKKEVFEGGEEWVSATP